MKKNIIYLLIAGCGLFLNACNDDDTLYTPPVEVQIASASVSFDALGGDGTIEVSNATSDLKATSNVAWCVVNSYSNGTISFNITANETMQTRTAVISIEMGESNRKVGITQLGYVAEYDLSTTFTATQNKAINQLIPFKSNLPVEVSVNPEAQAWLTYSKEAGGIRIQAKENTENAFREGLVTIQTGEITREYRFMQYSELFYNRAWTSRFLASTGDIAEETVNISVKKEEVEINFTESKYVFKGKMVDGVLTVPCAQFLGERRGYKLVLGLLSTNSVPALDPEISFNLAPALLPDGTWGLTVQDNGSWDQQIKTLTIFAFANDNQPQVWEFLTGIHFEAAGEILPPAPEYEIVQLNFDKIDKAECIKYPGEFYVKVFSNDWLQEMRLDFYTDPAATTLTAGTYNWGTGTDPFTFNDYSSVDIFEKGGMSNYKFEGGAVKVSTEGKNYVFEIDLIGKGGKKRFVGTFKGEITDLPVQ